MRLKTSRFAAGGLSALGLIFLGFGCATQEPASGGDSEEGQRSVEETGHLEGLAPESLPQHASCKVTQSWVTANRGHLPTQYDDLVRYPVPYRRDIYAALPEEIQSQLWREHLNRYLRAHPNLSQEQSALVQRVITAASPDLLGRRGEQRQISVSLEKEAVALFGKDEARRIFATMGTESAPQGRSAPQAKSAPQEQEHCYCSVEDDFCAVVCIWEDWCYHTPEGCGFLYSYPCDGWC